MKEITPSELKAWNDEKADFQLIDVREPYEYEIANIGGELIPLANIMAEKDRISRDKKVVIHCRSGKRSASAINALERGEGYNNLYNLIGGILAYADQVDPKLEKY